MKTQIVLNVQPFVLWEFSSKCGLSLHMKHNCLTDFWHKSLFGDYNELQRVKKEPFYLLNLC